LQALALPQQKDSERLSDFTRQFRHSVDWRIGAARRFRRMPTREEAIKVQFTAQLRKSPAKGGWSYVIWPESAEFFKTRGLVKVQGTIDGHPFQSAFMAMGGGVHKLPVKAETRQLLGKQTGDVVTVRLMARERR
jgi:hypothetical protein